MTRNSTTYGYERTLEEEATKATFKYDITTTIACSGSAVQLNVADPQWWWDTTVIVVEKKPVVEVLPEGGRWTTLEVDTTHDVRPVRVARDASGNNVPGAPVEPGEPANPGSSTISLPAGQDWSGHSAGFGATSPDMKRLRLEHVIVTTAGSSSGDNCMVNSEKVQLDFTVKSWFE